MRYLSEVWWAPMLRGIAAILFAVAALAAPHLTLISIGCLFGIYALTDGLLALCMGSGESDHSGLVRSLLMEGIIGSGIGLMTLCEPRLFASVGISLIAGWMLCAGLFRLAAARALARETRSDWHPIVMGLIAVVTGAFMFAFPLQSKMGLAWIVGGSALACGMIFIHFALRLRDLSSETMEVARTSPRAA